MLDITTQTSPLFSMGRLCATPGALALIQELGEPSMQSLIQRHLVGDWAEMAQEDQATNHYAIRCGARIFSSYALKTDAKVWIITESDRSLTTVLLPSEY